ncbi:MAG: serine--tRNA ligase [Candidatus Aenigmatarchaeota archaeon]
MLDIKLIRENPKLVEENLKKRHDTEKLKLLNELIKHDEEKRDVIQKVEKLKQLRNTVTKEIADLKAKGKSVSAKMKDVKEIPDKIKKLDDELASMNEKCNSILMRLPNMLHDSVPIGKDENDNVEIRKWGNPPRFSFEPKNHMEILEKLGLIDSERAAKVSGTGFFYLKEELVILDFAIQRFAIDMLRKRGYVLIEPPFMINRKAYEGMIDPSDFEMVTYKIEKEPMYLIATAEHPLGSMLMNDVLEKDRLPLKLIGVSPCFRKEIGSHGKYTKGLFRMHQFNKIEQFIFCLPEQSWKLHEELQKNCEDLYQALGLHYRVVNVCTGDIGTIAAKKYDTDVWMADGKYREIGSNSNCTDYQARRLGIRYREKAGTAPIGFVHTLNNTAMATSRTMIAIIEQHQQSDGSILIPKALQPYCGFEKIGKK